MTRFTDNIRRILKHSIKGAKLTPMKKGLTLLLMIGLLAGVASAQSQAQKVIQQPEEKSELKEVNRADLQATPGKSIVGTWLLTITPTGERPFRGIYTFFEDGNVLFSSVGPPIPALGNPGHGVWEKIGPNTFAVSWMQFTFGPDLQTDGSTLKINDKLTLIGIDDFTTQTQGKVCDADGNVLVTISGGSVGKRMKVERN